MVNHELNHEKSFNWREFFKIFGGIFLMCAGVSIGVYFKGELLPLIIGFGISAFGAAILFTD